jgi:site-specific DNA-methyltransferase (adenine-specific)
MMNSRYTLHNGDCRAVLASLADSSVDSIVCDPPYELGFMGKAWDKSGIANDPAIWAECLRVLKPGGHLLAFSGSRTYHRMACAIEDAGFELRDQLMWVYAQGMPKSRNIGEGRGTALKPSHEPICMARKPLEGTVAANVAKHGPGALYIDACRIGDEVRTESIGSLEACSGNAFGAPGTAEARRGAERIEREYVGRWPSNLLHDGSPEVVALFPESKGQRGAVTGNEPSSRTNNVYGQFNGRPATAPRVDLDTSAARFFYCPKASPADRHEGLQHPGPQFKKGTTLRKVEVAAAAGELTGNTHPTVKPTELMAYLCRLVTPPGGTVLDPFMGSGSTGKAAMREGFNFIGIELDAGYLAIADARIKFELLKQEPAPEPEAPLADVRQLDLLSHLSGF